MDTFLQLSCQGQARYNLECVGCLLFLESCNKLKDVSELNAPSKSYSLFVTLFNRSTSSGETNSCFNKSSSAIGGPDGLFSVFALPLLACLARKPPPFFFPGLFAFLAFALMVVDVGG